MGGYISTLCFGTESNEMLDYSLLGFDFFRKKKKVAVASAPIDASAELSAQDQDTAEKEQDQAAVVEGEALSSVMGYPAPPTGIGFCKSQNIIEYQSEIIGRLKNTVGITEEEFQKVVKPVIVEYANFVHLLPASQNHHHSGLGGLFRHGLEVAVYATLASHNVIFCTGYNPQDARKAEPRWRIGACIAALLHDVGKPVSDVIITVGKGGVTWQPHKENLAHWCNKIKAKKYFISWRDDRHKKHEQYSLFLLQRLIPEQTLDWLYESSDGKYIFDSILDAASEMKSPHVVTRLVKEADKRSVEKDLKKQYSKLSLEQISVPVERHILDAIRTLIRTKNWVCNQAGGRVWVFGDGFAHIPWRQSAPEAREILSRDEIHGVPHDADTLADILIDKGIAVPNDEDEFEGGLTTRYWAMKPALLAKNDKPITLEMLRIKIGYLFDGEPPPKAQLWTGKKKQEKIAEEKKQEVDASKSGSVKANVPPVVSICDSIAQTKKKNKSVPFLKKNANPVIQPGTEECEQGSAESSCETTSNDSSENPKANEGTQEKPPSLEALESYQIMQSSEDLTHTILTLALEKPESFTLSRESLWSEIS